LSVLAATLTFPVTSVSKSVMSAATTVMVLEPVSIVLFVKVCVSVVPTTVPVGAPDNAVMSMDASCCVTLETAIRASAKVPDVISEVACV